MNGSLRIGLSVLMFALVACGTLQVSVEGSPASDAGATGTVEALQTQNAALATRVAVLSQQAGSATAVLPRLTDSPAPPTVPPATRITFLKDSTVGVVSAPIAPGQTQNYVLDAFQGQPAYIYVASAASDVTLSITTDDGATLLDAAAHKLSWQGSLPRTGDYYLSIYGGGSAENFSLTVTIPLRLQFPQGTASETISGKTVAGYSVSYAVSGTQGQTMTVNLTDVSGKASLAMYGFKDGQRYVRSDDGRRSFKLVLPSTQDYIVVVVPMSASPVDYTMAVKIR